MKQSDSGIPHTPKLVVDGVIVDGERVVLIERKNPPFRGSWALPGGFVDVGETVEEATVREMREETSLDVEVGALLGVYSDPARDPRGHSVSVVHVCHVLGGELRGADDASDAQWFSFDELPELAFDHATIIADYIKILGE